MNQGRSSAVHAGAGAGLAVGAVLGGLENLWLALTHALAFDDALDRVLFVLAGTALEAAVGALVGAALALVLHVWAGRGGRTPSAASIGVPVAVFLGLLRVLPWIDGLVLYRYPLRTEVAAIGALGLAAAGFSVWVHARVERADASTRPTSSRGFGATAAAAGLAMLLSGIRFALPSGADQPPASGSGTSQAPTPQAALRLPEGTPVILVLVDTLRADHVSYAGYARDTSPTVDRLARAGVVFERAIAQATRTSPNMASLVTGTLPTTHGLILARSELDDELDTWGELLQEQGYATAAILANPNMGHHFQFTQGMEHVDEVFDEEAYDASVVLPRGLAWLADHLHEPSFLWLHAIDPHSPYAAPVETDFYRGDDVHAAAPSDPLPLTMTRSGGVFPEARLEGVSSLADYVARYDAEIRFFDEQFRIFLQGLEQLALPLAPLIVFTSDHGESLGDHDYYFSHGDFTHDATAHVPLVFHHPVLPSGARVRQVVRTMDVLPTVLDLLGVPRPRELEGRSLVPLLTGQQLPAEPSLTFSGTIGGTEVAVRDDRYKLVARAADAGLRDDWIALKLAGWPNARRTSPIRGPHYQFSLYDLVADPDEMTDVIGREPAVEAQLALHLRAATQGRAERFHKRNLSSRPVPDQMEEQLRALGYLE